ncbi:MAG: zinc-ribbon domain-containing protein [bacterium]
MDVKFCGQCGEAVQPSNRFCSSCGVALAAVAPSATETAQARLRAGVELLARSDNEGSLAILNALVNDEPTFAVARAYRGLANLRLVRVGDAREDLEESIRQAPDSFICRSKYAEFLARLGFFDQAVTQLDAALLLAPPDVESKLAAIELRNFSRDKAKGLYYRPLRYPDFSRLKPRSLFGRKALAVQGDN